VIDIGGGKGAHLAELALEGYECVCVDINLDFLRQAQRAGLSAIRMEAHALGFRENAFDTALMFDVIEHVQNPKQVLAEAKRVVTTNVLITTPCHDYSDSLYSLGLFVEGCLPFEHVNFFGSKDLGELIRSRFPSCTIVKDEPVFLPGFRKPFYYSRIYAEAVTESHGTEVTREAEQATLLDDVNEFTRIAERLNTIRSLEEQKTTLEEKLRSLKEQNSVLASEYAITLTILNGIRSSFGYKFMRFYGSRIDRIFPYNTRRGRIRKALVEAARAATERRFSSFLRNALQKARRHEFDLIQHSVPVAEYARWIQENEPTERDLHEQRGVARKFGYRPLISIVMPVWNPPPKVLTETIVSVLSQTYDNWELCVADGGSQEAVGAVLRKFVKRDKRIRVRFLNKNLGISENSNKAIDDASGEFIALLDHDDVLAPFALFEVVDCLNRKQELDFIYSDKDCMTADGKRFNPLFKPDWSPDTMLSANYVTHLCVVRTSLVKELGGFRPETDGAQDWDLFFRITEKTTGAFHIPKVLYHWKQTPQSVLSAGFQAKPYALRAQLLTVNQHLARKGCEGTIECDVSGHFRVKWRLARKPKVSIVIHTSDSDTSLMLPRCLGSIFHESSYKNFEVVVVCHNSQAAALQQEFEGVRFLQSDYELNFSLGNNLGAEHARGEVLVFLDPAAEVLTTDWLQELAGWASEAEIGAVGAKLLSPDGRIFHGGVIVGLCGYVFGGASEGSWSAYGDTEWYRDYSAVSGSCIATSKTVFDEVGGFNERLETAADINFCHRAQRSGYRILYTPHAKLMLHRPRDLSVHATRLPDLLEDSEMFKASQNDPYFNPNLSYGSTIPSLKTAPSHLATLLPTVPPAIVL
jgi:GT2 family glycosyltransferase